MRHNTGEGRAGAGCTNSTLGIDKYRRRTILDDPRPFSLPQCSNGSLEVPGIYMNFKAVIDLMSG
jgi:hypothetical protein